MRIGMGGGAAQLDGGRRQRRRARLRLGAARQPRDPAPRAGGHQPLLGARRRTTRSWRSTTSAPAAIATPSPSWSTAPAWAARFDLRKVPLEETRPGAEGDLVQREPGALRRSRIAPEALPLFARCAMRERCPFAVVGVATRRRPARARRRARRASETRHRHADGGAARQAAARCTATSARRARRPELDLTGIDARARRASTCCATRPWRASAS